MSKLNDYMHQLSNIPVNVAQIIKIFDEPSK